MLDQVCRLAQGRHCHKSRGFFYGIALLDPVGSEAGGKNQDAEMGETHFAQSCERRAEIGATIQWAAAAVEDDVRIFG